MLGITMFNEEGGVATLELKDGTSWELVSEDLPSAFGIGWDELNEWSVGDLLNAGWEPV